MKKNKKIQELSESLYCLIFSPAWLSFLISMGYLIYKGWFWLKNGYWPSITLRDSLISANLISPDFYFYLPTFKGIEQVLNSTLISSAIFFYLCISIVLFLIINAILEKTTL